MALDGAFLHHLKAELQSALLHCRVEKIYQPAKEEIVLSMRGAGGAHKLLLSSRANSPRAALTAYAPENPQTLRNLFQVYVFKSVFNGNCIILYFHGIISHDKSSYTKKEYK